MYEEVVSYLLAFRGFLQTLQLSPCTNFRFPKTHNKVQPSEIYIFNFTTFDQVLIVFSTPEHEVLFVCYCDWPMSVVHRSVNNFL